MNEFMTREVKLVFSETWLKMSTDDIRDLLNETINEFVDPNDKIVNIERHTEDNGLSRFWIYVDTPIIK